MRPPRRTRGITANDRRHNTAHTPRPLQNRADIPQHVGKRSRRDASRCVRTRHTRGITRTIRRHVTAHIPNQRPPRIRKRNCRDPSRCVRRATHAASPLRQSGNLYHQNPPRQLRTCGTRNSKTRRTPPLNPGPHRARIRTSHTSRRHPRSRHISLRLRLRLRDRP